MAKKNNKDESLRTVKVQQYRSSIRRDKCQALYLKSLGLGKINAIRELQDNGTVRSLLAKTHHLVKIISD